MDPTISDTGMFFTTAKEIWDSMQRTYSKARDATKVYEIKVRTSATKKVGKSVTKYANLLKNLWQQLDHYQVFEVKCPEEAAIQNNLNEDQGYDFLARLNPEFDQVRVQILGKEETPSLEETISLVRAKDSRRGIMLEPQVLDGSALVNNLIHKKGGKQPCQNHHGEITRIICVPTLKNQGTPTRIAGN